MKEKRKALFSFFPVGDSQKSKCVFCKVYAWLGFLVKVGTLFFTKSVKFGFCELSICRICAESRDLQSGHGFRACSFKNKRTKLKFHEKWKSQPCFDTKSVRSGRTELSFSLESSPRDLAIEKGFRACFLLQ